MIFNRIFKENKGKKENIQRLLKLDKREVRYVSSRDSETNVEYVLGKSGIINIEGDIFSIICGDKKIFESSIYEMTGSELLSLDGIIITTKNKDYTEMIVYFKYYRKVD